MARVTVSDCLDHVENRFELVLVASKRTRQLILGAQPKVPPGEDKPTVIALREIAEGLIGPSILEEEAVMPMPSPSSLFGSHAAHDDWDEDRVDNERGALDGFGEVNVGGEFDAARDTQMAGGHAMHDTGDGDTAATTDTAPNIDAVADAHAAFDAPAPDAPNASDTPEANDDPFQTQSGDESADIEPLETHD